MSIQDLKIDLESRKDIARREHESCLSTRASMLEEHSASFRWMMASLLAINAGALTMVKDAFAANAVWASFAGTSFFVGIACSLLIARFGQKAIQAMIGPLSEAVAFWSIVSVTGEFVQDVHDAIGVKINTAMAKGKIPSFFGFAAFAAFSVGLASLGMAHFSLTRDGSASQLQGTEKTKLTEVQPTAK